MEEETKKELTLFSCSVVAFSFLVFFQRDGRVRSVSRGMRKSLQPHCSSLPSREEEDDVREVTGAERCERAECKGRPVTMFGEHEGSAMSKRTGQ